MARIHLVGAQLGTIAALVAACRGSDQARQAGAESAAADSSAQASAASADRHVTSVMIGRQIGAGNRIIEPTFQFAPEDTVYLSIGTEGSSGATILATAWRFQSGEIVQKSSEAAQPSGENTAFSLAQPKGLKPGTYKVIVFLGNDSVDTKVFVVKK